MGAKKRGWIFVGCEHDSRQDMTSIISQLSEGICPVCETPTERGDYYSRCPCCKAGWRIEPLGITFHVPIVKPRPSRET